MPDRRAWMVLALLVATTGLVRAEPADEAPALINYQGVLRDSNDQPLDGFFPMVFRFWSADAGGDEILVNVVPPVRVTNGLFNVPLGDGQIFDGAGPGVYGSLAEVFRDYEPVYLEVEIAGELLTPKVRILAAAYSLNSASVGGKSAGSLLDDGAATQTKSGTLELYADDARFGIIGTGGAAGGQFRDREGSGFASVGVGDIGIDAFGTAAGGVFTDLDGTGWARLADGDDGLFARGHLSGGAFENSSPVITATAYLAADGGDPGQPAGVGVIASGDTAGGFFSAEGFTGWASPGFGDWGLVAAGGSQTDGGGILGEDALTGTFGYLGWLYSTTAGNGTKNFVQNHPLEDDKVIVYSAPEGDEVGTYTRGEARLVDGVARVPLGATFAWTTNPDIGLTAHVTPREECDGLFVESVTTSELVVRELGGGRSDAAFDYVVRGLRIGFEGVSVVRPKQHEAFIPAMEEELLRQRNPELERFNARSRFREMRLATGRLEEVDPGAARALEAAIGRVPRATGSVAAGRARRPVATAAKPPAKRLEAVPTESDDVAGHDLPVASPRTPEKAVELPQAPSTLLALFDAVEEVTAGSVLTLDPARPGALALARAAEDPGVVGIVAAETPDQGARIAVVVSGVTSCRVDAGFGSIRPGDLLTTSPTPGHAMRSVNGWPGTVLGKALGSLEAGVGTIRVLVMPR